MKRDEETTRLSTLLATPMGKVMSSGGPEYTPEEVVTMQAADAQAEIPAEQVLVQQVAELNDPNAPDQTKDEWRRRTQLKKSLQEQGLLDSDFMATTKGVGGLVMTIADGVTSPLRYDPRDENGNVIPSEGALEYISRYNPATWPAAQADAALRLPATLNYAGELLEQGYGIMSDGLAGMGGPRYKVKETGDFITEMDRAMYRTKVAQTGGLAGDPSDDALIKQYAAQGMTLEPVTPEDVEEFEYQQHLRFRGRLKSMEQKRTEGVGSEVLTASAMSLSAAPLDWMTGSNYMDQVWGKKLPAESQAMAMQMGADPMVWTSFGAGLTRLGVSTAAKGGGARILDAIGKGAQKMARPTEQSLREVQRFQNAVWSKGRVALYAGGLAGMNYSSLPEPLKNAMNVAAAAYVIHKGGAGTLRWVGDKFPQAAIMLREAADPLNGADIMARQAIAKNAKIPASIRERVARPSQFVSMESTPARLARNEALSPKTRKMMERLSNFYVVQGVRGASAVATGATKGAIAAVPFAELTRGGGDEEGANLIYGAGTALGGTGGAASRVFGARNRTVARAESDIGRMLIEVQGAVPELQRQGAVKRNQWFDRELNRFLTDVELAGGDIAHMFQARSFDEIARTAAMQGMFRNVDYVPLNDADFALNAEAHGQSGAAGFYLHNPDGARPRLFVNLDARRADVDAHEFGEAFFSSDAFSPEQKAAMRAEVDARYGTDGVTARAREYAEQMVKSENARNFPNETLVVSDEQIRAKMDELAQDELGRGGQDPADWARREIMVEEWRMAGTDYARLRRGVPAGANPVTFVENILGANARALGLSGVRIDPETGQAVTPDQLFKENPVAADNPIVNRNLRAYIKTYNAWLNDPSQEAPSGVKVARDGNVQSFANNPNVDFYSSDPDNPTAPRENTFAVLGPDGRVIEKSPKQRRDERKARNTQVKNMAGRNLLAPGDAAFGLKRRADGRVVASGRRLPQSIILQNHWKPWLPIINMLETMADSNESMQVRYFAAGNSADKVKTAKPTDVVAINREMVFDQWTTNKDGDLLAQFLDLTSMRNRAMRAIGERNPALDPANGGPGYSLQAIMDDVNQWMADKRAGKAGEATIGPDRKNIVNALINPGTVVNRGKNPLAGSMGKGSAIKTLILEGINAVSGTGRKGAAMDYNWANGNFMPDQPPPRPDVDIDLPQDRMPSALPQAGMAMPDVAVVPERFTGTGQEPNRQSRFAQPPPFFARFPIESYERGGKFFDAESGEDLTGRSYGAGFIDVSSGKPRLFVDGDPATQPAKSGRTYRTNLFKQKAGWKWISDNAPTTSTIVSVEGGGRHVYSLRADFEGGVDLARYSDKPSEPRLRPTARGELSLGNEVGRISIRGKEHPVYDGARIAQQDVPRGQAMPDVEARSGAAETLDQLKRSQFIPTRVAAEVVGGFPEYLRPVAQFITDQRQKLADGQMTRRDVMKAYAMTVASQGSGARAVEVIANNVAKDGVRFRPSKDFTTVDKQGRAAIRPEEAAAYWLGTDAGQRALNNFEAGRFSPDDWKELVAIRKAYGDDRFNNLGAFNPENIRTMDKVLADINASGADTGGVMDAVQQLRGIKTGKKGFISHLLGIGDVPTIDAVEINFWLTGKADIGKLNTRRATLARNIKNSISDKRVSEEMFRRIDQRINALRDEVPGGAEVAPEVWSHVMHHWLWDKSKGIETTHEGMYRAQAQFMPDVVVKDEGGTVWKEVQNAPIVSLKDFEGRPVFAAFADLTSAGKIYRGIDSSEIAVPVETHGGPEWPLIQDEVVGKETDVWTNQGAGVSAMKARRANEGAIMLVAAMDKNAHVSNTETATAVIATNAAYASDGRITPENLAALDNSIRKEIEDFPGIESPSIMEYVNKLPFQGAKSRARIAEILESKKSQDLGAPNVQRILDEMRSDQYDGLRIGDMVLAIELTPGAPVVKLGEQGTMVHPSYQYAVRGRVIGRFARPINIASVFDDFYAKRRAEGKPELGDRRAFDLAKPVQVITPAIAARIPGTPYNSFRSPRHAQVINMAKDDRWRSSEQTVKAGGVSPAAFIDALNASPAKLALDRYTLKGLQEKLETGAMSIYQLGDAQVFFGIKQGDPASSYGQDPAAFGFGPNEKTLSLVLNNERKTGGMADAIVMKSLQLGVTALDCFAVKSPDYPAGMLPKLYASYGFEKTGTIPFDPQYYSKTELADLKKYWKSIGWDDTLGLPEIVLMKWKGNDELRTKSLREIVEQSGAGVRGRLGQAVADARDGRKPPARAVRGRKRRSGQGDAVAGARSQEDAGGGVRLSRGFLGAYDELLSMSPDELRNLGIK